MRGKVAWTTQETMLTALAGMYRGASLARVVQVPTRAPRLPPKTLIAMAVARAES